MSVHAPGAVPNVEVTVEAFIEHVSEPLALELLAGRSGIHRTLRSARIQKPGLALAGYTTYVHNDRVQVLGQTELSYLHTLEPEPRRQAIESLLSLELACVLLTKGLAAPVELLEICERHATPLLRTPLTSSVGIRKVLGFLDDLLSPRTSMHGASGIGKSECALDLVLRGHRLVADDVVEIRRRGDDLVGQASNMIRNLIEIRGLGILNVADLYGVAATRIHKRIELHVELEMWRAQRLYDRIGLEERHKDVLGVPIPSLLIPVRPGRDIAAIVEVAARNALLRIRGHHAARDLNDQIETNLTQSPRAVDVMAQLEAARAGPTDLRRAAQLTELNDHIEDEVE